MKMRSFDRSYLSSSDTPWIVMGILLSASVQSDSGVFLKPVFRRFADASNKIGGRNIVTYSG
jgi:hypothetical protein